MMLIADTEEETFWVNAELPPPTDGICIVSTSQNPQLKHSSMALFNHGRWIDDTGSIISAQVTYWTDVHDPALAEKSFVEAARQAHVYITPKTGTLKFVEVRRGECFRPILENEVYMSIYVPGQGQMAVNMETGEAMFINPSCRVVLVPNRRTHGHGKRSERQG